MCLQLTLIVHKINGLHTMKTLENRHHRIFTHLRNRNDLQHTRHHAGRVQITFLRIGHFSVFLCQQNQMAVVLVRSLNQFQTAFLRHRYRQQHSRKQHRVFNWQHIIIRLIHILVLLCYVLKLCLFNIFFFFHISIVGFFSNYAILHNHD